MAIGLRRVEVPRIEFNPETLCYDPYGRLDIREGGIRSEHIKVNAVRDEHIGAHTTTKITVPKERLSGVFPLKTDDLGDDIVTDAKIKVHETTKITVPKERLSGVYPIVRDDLEDKIINTAKIDDLDYITFKALTANPTLATGRVWHRDTSPFLRFSPDGTAIRYADVVHHREIRPLDHLDESVTTPKIALYAAKIPERAFFKSVIYTGLRIWRKAGLDWDAASGVAFSPDGKYVCVASHLADAVELMSAADGTRIWRKAGLDWDGARGVAFSPDGKYVCVVSLTADAVELMSATDGTRIWRKAGADWDEAACVAFSPDGKYVCVASRLADAVEAMY